MQNTSRTSRFFTGKEKLNDFSPDGLYPMVRNTFRYVDVFSDMAGIFPDMSYIIDE
jgi:hypothetical protein